MVYTVTLNPAIDYVMNVQELDFSDINRSCSESMTYGGKGINVSVILTRLGVDNTALGFVGGFTGTELENMLSFDGICTDFTHLSNGNTRVNVKIRSNSEFDVNANGPVVSDSDVDALLSKLDAVQGGDYVVLAGSIPNNMSSDIYQRIMSKLDNKGVNFVVDATGDLLKNALKYKPFLIKPNHHELGDLFGVEIKNEDDIVRYAKKLQDLGARNVLVSWSKNGAVLVDENGNVQRQGNLEGKLINSVGCGDSMVAGFVAGYIEKSDYSYALLLGSACSNASAFSQVLATKDEIFHALERYNQEGAII